MRDKLAQAYSHTNAHTLVRPPNTHKCIQTHTHSLSLSRAHTHAHTLSDLCKHTRTHTSHAHTRRLSEAERDLKAVRDQVRQHSTRRKHLEELCAQLEAPMPPGLPSQQQVMLLQHHQRLSSQVRGYGCGCGCGSVLLRVCVLEGVK